VITDRGAGGAGPATVGEPDQKRELHWQITPTTVVGPVIDGQAIAAVSRQVGGMGLARKPLRARSK